MNRTAIELLIAVTVGESVAADLSQITSYIFCHASLVSRFGTELKVGSMEQRRVSHRTKASFLRDPRLHLFCMQRDQLQSRRTGLARLIFPTGSNQGSSTPRPHTPSPDNMPSRETQQHALFLPVPRCLHRHSCRRRGSFLHSCLLAVVGDDLVSVCLRCFI